MGFAHFRFYYLWFGNYHKVHKDSAIPLHQCCTCRQCSLSMFMKFKQKYPEITTLFFTLHAECIDEKYHPFQDTKKERKTFCTFGFFLCCTESKTSNVKKKQDIRKCFICINHPRCDVVTWQINVLCRSFLNASMYLMKTNYRLKWEWWMKVVCETYCLVGIISKKMRLWKNGYVDSLIF